jgi:hypothetical protein
MERVGKLAGNDSVVCLVGLARLADTPQNPERHGQKAVSSKHIRLLNPISNLRPTTYSL